MCKEKAKVKEKSVISGCFSWGSMQSRSSSSSLSLSTSHHAQHPPLPPPLEPSPALIAALDAVRASGSPLAMRAEVARVRREEADRLARDPALLSAYVTTAVECFSASLNDVATQNWCVVMLAELLPRHDPVAAVLEELGVERETLQSHSNYEHTAALAAVARVVSGRPELMRRIANLTQ